MADSRSIEKSTDFSKDALDGHDYIDIWANLEAGPHEILLEVLKKLPFQALLSLSEVSTACNLFAHDDINYLSRYRSTFGQSPVFKNDYKNQFIIECLYRQTEACVHPFKKFFLSEKVLDFLKLPQVQGSPWSFFYLGNIYLKSDWKQGIHYFNQSIQANDYRTAVTICEFYHQCSKGYTLYDPNDKNSEMIGLLDYLRKNCNFKSIYSLLFIAHEKGIKAATKAIGFCYVYGLGVTPDLKEAAQWLNIAFERGDINSAKLMAALIAWDALVNEKERIEKVLKNRPWLLTLSEGTILNDAENELLLKHNVLLALFKVPDVNQDINLSHFPFYILELLADELSRLDTLGEELIEEDQQMPILLLWKTFIPPCKAFLNNLFDGVDKENKNALALLIGHFHDDFIIGKHGEDESTDSIWIEDIENMRSWFSQASDPINCVIGRQALIKLAKCDGLMNMELIQKAAHFELTYLFEGAHHLLKTANQLHEKAGQCLIKAKKSLLQAYDEGKGDFIAGEKLIKLLDTYSELQGDAYDEWRMSLLKNLINSGSEHAAYLLGHVGYNRVKNLNGEIESKQLASLMWPLHLAAQCRHAESRKYLSDGYNSDLHVDYRKYIHCIFAMMEITGHQQPLGKSKLAEYDLSYLDNYLQAGVEEGFLDEKTKGALQHLIEMRVQQEKLELLEEKLSEENHHSDMHP